MITLRLFASRTLSVHPTTAWHLADLGAFRGMQTLDTWQSAERLKGLRGHALIEGEVSSIRIEGVSIEAARVGEVLVGASPLFRDRDEEEVYLATLLRGVAHIPGALRPGSDGDAAQMPDRCVTPQRDRERIRCDLPVARMERSGIRVRPLRMPIDQ